MVKILGFDYAGTAFDGRPDEGARGLPGLPEGPPRELTLASAREGLPYE
ncbi:MAG: hypothetical protein NT056_09660 [Proteobacteria bacterium]|nr:hypothetical protein [Pseudomonadota bacterium]